MKNIDWKILKVLYEKRSMTKAAEALYMTQPALTKRIKAMEEEWGVEIVKRSSKGVIFTEDGKYLVWRATIMLDFLQEMKDHFSKGENYQELLRIGVPNSFARLHLPELLKGFLEQNDRLQIITVSNSSDNLVRQLTDGSVDIAIICGDYPFMGEKTCLFSEELSIVTPKGMTIDEIVRQPLIESYLNPMVKLMVDQWWKMQFGSLPHESLRVPYADIAIEMVNHGLGVSFLFGNKWKVDEEKIQLIPLYDNQGKRISRNVWMMMNDHCFRSENIMDFVTFTEKYYQVN